MSIDILVFYNLSQKFVSVVDPSYYLCFIFVFVMLSWLVLAALWSPAGNVLTYWLSCVWCLLLWCQVWYLIVSIPDLCLLLYCTLKTFFRINGVPNNILAYSSICTWDNILTGPTGWMDVSKCDHWRYNNMQEWCELWGLNQLINGFDN